MLEALGMGDQRSKFLRLCCLVDWYSTRCLLSLIPCDFCRPFARLWWDETVPTVVTRAEPHNQVYCILITIMQSDCTEFSFYECNQLIISFTGDSAS